MYFKAAKSPSKLSRMEDGGDCLPHRLTMKIFNAGPITVEYENGFLRRISYGNTEVLRMIYFALRDHNWNTLPLRIGQQEFSASPDGHFDISYTCVNEHADAAVMKWSVTISGKGDGTIEFSIHGTALQDFNKNRAGFCVLHPLTFAGHDCSITHPDGTVSKSRFPERVSPENPFMKIRAMTWTAAQHEYSLHFEGDVFETEDQRNWSDASFKTFCTPLANPFPVQLKKGENVFQRVTFRPKQTLPTPAKRDSFISLTLTGNISRLPSLGTADAPSSADLSARVVAGMKALNLRHYRIDVHPERDVWVADFSAAYERAYAFGLPLEVALHLTANFREEMESFAVLCLQNKVRLRKVLLLREKHLVTGRDIVKEASGLQAKLPRVAVGAGTDFNFNEINKNRFSPGSLNFISFSINPQEHATDDLTILENAETQAFLVKSAREIYGDSTAIHVSPVTLKRRFNPYATNPDDLFLDESQKTDSRQKEVLTALWTFESVCSLARGGADAVTYYQALGDQGIMSAAGDPYPVYETLKSFSPYQRKKVEILESSDPLAAQGILLDDHMLAVANLCQEMKEVRITGQRIMLKPQEIKFLPLDRP